MFRAFPALPSSGSGRNAQSVPVGFSPDGLSDQIFPAAVSGPTDTPGHPGASGIPAQRSAYLTITTSPFFGDKHLPCRLGFVLSPLKSAVERSEIVMRVSFITVPCHSVAAGGSLTFELMEALQQQRFVYVVEKTGKLLIFITLRSFPHSQQT